MATYAIGDIQGCLSYLKELLQFIQYDPNNDVLWFTGDLVNRGPESLATLHYIRSLPDSTVIVLGNHDLSLLAAIEGAIKPGPKDTIDDILCSQDKKELSNWLRSLPLLHHDNKLGFTLAHAGVYPTWDLATAKSCALEVETILQGSSMREFMYNMYGDTPSKWEDCLTGWGRVRAITNAFTRMRFCTMDGTLDLDSKGHNPNSPDLVPWFEVPDRPMANEDIVFGHWAQLQGKCNTEHVYPLDTGCVWGQRLSAMCLETKKIFSTPCK